jgi:diguanylate cyclase (GGDEF)-like protein
MTAAPWQPLILLVAEAAGIAALLLALFSLRSELGLVPLSVTVGVLQLFQNLLAATVYIRVAPGVLVGPGSVIVFTANLSTILLVYIREDALEARKLAYGIIGANVLAGLLMYLTGVGLDHPWVVNLAGVPAALFRQNLRVSIASTVALAVDVIAVILLYEAVSRRVRRSFFARIAITMTAILAGDTVLFITGAFAGEPEYGSLLLWNLLGKSVCGLFFSAVLRVYLHYTGRGDPHGPRGAVRDIFHLLTFRQKYEAVTELVYRDALTGVYSRRFFDEILPRELSLARRSERPLALIMIDLDRFKSVNDTHGHQTGDAALRALAQFVVRGVRSTDVVCRFGGEEFVVVLSDTTAAGAAALAEKLSAQLKEAQLQGGEEWALPVIFTITCGVAGFPEDGSEADTLVRAADTRLYRGKDEGRDRVVGPPD